MKDHWKITILILTIAAAAIWLAVFSVEKSKLKIIACDVGQGDAILVTLGSTQVLTDGGLPNGKVVECISRHMPFWDREIEVVINTHPQLDHYGGLIEVVKRYKVRYFLASGLDSGSQEYGVLKNEVLKRGIEVLNPTDDLSLRLGLIYLDMFWPNKQFIDSNSDGQANTERMNNTTKGGVLGSYTTSLDPNQFSIVAGLHYHNFDALLTGDLDPTVSDNIAQILGMTKKIDWEYIKVPHHGSKNGLTENLLKVIDPEVAVISAGKNNRYGHPHKEVLHMLENLNITVLRTDTTGDLVIVTNGDGYKVRN